MTSSVDPPPMSTTSVGVSSLGSRSLVAPRKVSCASCSPDEHVRLDAVSIAHHPSELLAVGSVAYGAGQHGDRLVDAGRVHQRAVGVERVEHALHGVVAQPAVGVDPGSQPRDLRPPLQLGVDAPVLHVGDQQPRGVGPDVDDGDVHQTT